MPICGGDGESLVPRSGVYLPSSAFGSSSHGEDQPPLRDVSGRFALVDEADDPGNASDRVRRRSRRRGRLKTGGPKSVDFNFLVCDCWIPVLMTRPATVLLNQDKFDGQWVFAPLIAGHWRS